MNCPNCRSRVNNNDSICPKCSFPLPKMGTANISKVKGNQQNQVVSSNQNIQNNNQFVDTTFDYQSVINKTSNGVNPLGLQKEDAKQANTKTKAKKSGPVKTKKIPKENSNATKKKGSSKWIIVLLIIIILGLTGYIAYDKLLNKKQPVEKIVNKTETIYTEKEDYLLTDQEAYSVGKQLWNLSFDTVWCKNFNYSDKLENLSDGKKGYEITNYNELIKNFGDDFSYEYNDEQLKFNDIFENLQQNDKYYDFNKCNRKEDTRYLGTDLATKENTENKITYTATSTYCDKNWRGACINEDKIEKVEKDFVITKSDKEWKIQYFYLPN